jgi:regulator of RNase E activity RraA
MDPAIRPVWKPVRMVGIAKTFQLLRRREYWRFDSFEDYMMKTQVGYVYLKEGDKGVRDWENPVDEFLRRGQSLKDTVLVYQSGERIPHGFWGSEISLRAMALGVVGTVFDGGCRDTEQIELQKYPMFARSITCTHGGVRLYLAAEDIQIECGGVSVRPGDVVVGDSDGVVVVPQEKADVVADLALKVLDQDLKWRRMYYEQLGLKPDASLEG